MFDNNSNKKKKVESTSDDKFNHKITLAHSSGYSLEFCCTRQSYRNILGNRNGLSDLTIKAYPIVDVYIPAEEDGEEGHWTEEISKDQHEYTFMASEYPLISCLVLKDKHED